MKRHSSHPNSWLPYSGHAWLCPISIIYGYVYTRVRSKFSSSLCVNTTGCYLYERSSRNTLMPQLNFIQGMISLLNFILTGIIIIKLINSNLKIKSPVAKK